MLAKPLFTYCLCSWLTTFPGRFIENFLHVQHELPSSAEAIRGFGIPFLDRKPVFVVSMKSTDEIVGFWLLTILKNFIQLKILVYQDTQ